MNILKVETYEWKKSTERHKQRHRIFSNQLKGGYYPLISNQQRKSPAFIFVAHGARVWAHKTTQFFALKTDFLYQINL